MMNWYNQNIEEPVREIVRHLRDNGFNTVSSCGHEMEIQCSYIVDGEIKRLHDLIWNFLHESKQEITFTITVHHQVIDRCHYPFLEIDLKPTLNGLSASHG